jgi:hypothetical protein
MEKWPRDSYMRRAVTEGAGGLLLARRSGGKNRRPLVRKVRWRNRESIFTCYVVTRVAPWSPSSHLK